MDDMKYILIQDDDSHWYICPADKQEEATAYLAAVYDYWNDQEDVGGPPVEPAYLVRVGGAPSLVKFTGYSIG